MIIKGILIVFEFIFAILGLCELIHGIRLILFSSAKKNNVYSVVFLSPERAVGQIGFLSEQLCWLGSDFADYAIALTDLLDESELSDALSAAEGKNITFCKTEELTQKIKEIREKA